MGKKLYILIVVVIFSFYQVNAQNSLKKNELKLGVSIDGKECHNYTKPNNSFSSKAGKGIVLPQFLSLLQADSTTGNWYPNDSLHTLEAKYTLNGFLDTVIFMQGATEDTLKRMGVVFGLDGMPVEEVHEIFLGPDGWYNDERFVFYHDEKGNDTLIADYYWSDQLFDWLMTWGERHEFNYDAQGRIFEDTRYRWDAMDLYWVPEEMLIYDYIPLANGREIVETQKFYDGEGWIEYERLTLVFDEDDIITEIIVEHWNPTSMAWQNTVQVIDLVWHILYDENEKFHWNTQEGGFEDLNLPTTDDNFDMLFELYYLNGLDNKNRVKSCIVNEWDNGNESWFNIEKFNYDFDEYGGYTGVKLVYDGSVWTNKEKYELHINPKGDVEAYVEYEWNGVDWSQTGGPVFQITYEGDEITNVVWQEFDDDIQAYKNKQEESYWDFTNIEGDCHANFSYEVTDLNVFFYDASMGNITNEVWDFGNGVVWDTMAYDFNYTYDSPGYYDVTLFVFDENTNTSDDTTITILIGNDPSSCMANYSYSVSGLNVDFVNNSQGNLTYYYWEFGDGTVSMQESPSYAYPVDGIFTVTLTVYDENSGCMDVYEELIAVGDPSLDCEADFMYFVDPQTRIAYFTNTSLPETMDNYFWNFGDNGNSSSENPVHQYGEEGYYPVCLSVWSNDETCYNTTCKNIYIEGDNACNASFMFAIDEATNTVTFADYSMGEVIAWNYDFGDGNSATIPYPEHTYSDTGMYLVHLNILTESGCTSDFFELVNVNSDHEGIMGLFGFVQEDSNAKGRPINFKGAVYGEPSRSSWIFGDGESDSSTLYPKHFYQEDGLYNVCLTVSDPILDQTYTYCKDIRVGPEIVEEKESSTIGISIFPNPFNEYANIEIAIPSYEGEVLIELFDILGNKVRTIANSTKHNSRVWKSKLDKGSLEKGLYLIKVSTKDKISTKRVIISG